MTTATLSQFARGLSTETAFDVLAVAKRLKAQGKDVIELQIGDSPFPSTAHALDAGIKAIDDGQTHYCPSLGLPSFREAVAANYQKEYGIDITAGERRRRPRRQGLRAVLLRGVPRSGRRGAGLQPALPDLRPEHRAPRRRASVIVALKQENAVPARPQRRRDASSRRRPRPRRSSSTRRTTRPAASPPKTTSRASPTWSAARTSRSSATSRTATWSGPASITRCSPSRACSTRPSPCYTFSKSYSMSGWRLGYAVSSPRIIDVDRQDDQHVAVVRAADRAARRARRRSSTTPPSATR